MALLFTESFDVCGLSNLTEGRWTSRNVVGGTNTISAGNGRNATSSYRCNPDTQINLRKTIPALATYGMGFAARFNLVNSGGTAIDLCSFRYNSTAQLDLIANLNGTISLTRNGTVLATSATAVSDNTYFHIQWKATIDDAVGSSVVKLNNVEIINVSGVDTQNHASALIDEVVLGNVRVATTISNRIIDFDDFYLFDTTGAAPQNDFMGDCYVSAAFPDADGSSLQFTLSTGSDHYAVVDENPPSMTDYSESSTNGHIELLSFADFASFTAATIYGMQVNIYGLNPEGGGKNIATRVFTSSTASNGATTALPAASAYIYHIFTSNPSTNAAWTLSAANSAEKGLTVIS